MYLYDFRPIPGEPDKVKHLKLPIPPEWTLEDLDYFLAQKTGFERKGSMIDQAVDPAPLAVPPFGERDIKMIAEFASAVPAVQDSAGRCPKHPHYKGLRLGKDAKICPTCLAYFNRADRPREKRIRGKGLK